MRCGGLGLWGCVQGSRAMLGLPAQMVPKWQEREQWVPEACDHCTVLSCPRLLRSPAGPSGRSYRKGTRSYYLLLSVPNFSRPLAACRLFPNPAGCASWAPPWVCPPPPPGLAWSPHSPCARWGRPGAWASPACRCCSRVPAVRSAHHGDCGQPRPKLARWQAGNRESPAPLLWAFTS